MTDGTLFALISDTTTLPWIIIHWVVLQLCPVNTDQYQHFSFDRKTEKEKQIKLSSLISLWSFYTIEIYVLLQPQRKGKTIYGSRIGGDCNMALMEDWKKAY